jgi:hypothetical protein
MFILTDFFWHPMKSDTGGKGPMREDGISIYLSLVRSKEASDVGLVVGGFFSGHPMKGGHWRKWTNERGGNSIYLSLVGSQETSDVGIIVEQQQLVAP